MYMAIAFGRDHLLKRVYGALIPFDRDEIADMREFESRAGRGAIDIYYKGPDAARARSAIKHLRQMTDPDVLDELMDKAFPI